MRFRGRYLRMVEWILRLGFPVYQFGLDTLADSDRIARPHAANQRQEIRSRRAVHPVHATYSTRISDSPPNAT